MNRLFATLFLVALAFVEFAAITVATVAPAEAYVVVRRRPVARRAVVVHRRPVIVRRPVVVAPVRRRGVVIVR